MITCKEALDAANKHLVHLVDSHIATFEHELFDIDTLINHLDMSIEDASKAGCRSLCIYTDTSDYDAEKHGVYLDVVFDAKELVEKVGFYAHVNDVYHGVGNSGVYLLVCWFYEGEVSA